MKYKIVRMYRDDRPSKIMYTGFTLEQAQAHCQNPNTSGDGWFDGYEEETEITITGLRSALKRWNKYFNILGARKNYQGFWRVD